MRFSNRQWSVSQPVTPALLAQFPELPPIVVQLLNNRGIMSQAAVDEFLHPEWGRDVHDPFLFSSMERVVERLVRAIEQKEKIVIYGDYDADGVTSSAILAETFRTLGGSWDVYIPYRQTEGYGLNIPAIEEIAAGGAKVVITVDCGSSNVAEVAQAKKLGLDIIITDHHHEPPVKPKPYAFINPAFAGEPYPFKLLSAGGVAFKIVQALLRKTQSGASLGKPVPEGWEKWLLDLVTISTIADMVPLVGENRTLVQFGLTVLHKTRHLGIRELVASAGLTLASVTAADIAYILAPRINAAGRLNHASTAFKLLITADSTEAKDLSRELGQANTERQRLTKEVYQAAKIQIGEQPSQPIVFAGDTAWSAGILGLVAGKLVQHYGKPAIVYGSLQGQTVASGRSIPALNIIEAMDEVRDVLSRYGGHSQACGMTLTTPDMRGQFEARLTAVVERRLADQDVRPVLAIDARLAVESVDWPLIESLTQLEPHGIGNPKPRFLAERVEITAIQRVGGDQQHLRLSVVDGDHVIRKMIGFSFGEQGESLTVGETIDVVYETGLHTWNGNREIELKMIDAKHSHEPL